MGFVNIKNNLTVGVDIGGSHIAAAAIEQNKLIAQTYTLAKVDSGLEADVIIANWISAIKNVFMDTAANKCIAVAMPGPFDYENGISLITGMNKYESLYGLNIREIFSTQLSVQASNIHFFNDAKCFILGEAVAGAALGFNKIIGITIGTGLGSARCTNLIAEDVNRGSSHFLNGIVEDYLSTRWFTKRYQEITGNSITDVKTLCSLIDEENVVAQIFNEFAQNLSDFLSVFISDELPEVVVIGGNIAQAANRFLATVKSKLAEKFPEVQIKVTELWDHAALIGACSAVNEINKTSGQLEIEI
jgi:glucokinase